MEAIKQVFRNIDFHLNAKNRSLTIIYGDSYITLQLTEDGRMNLQTNLFLERPTQQGPSDQTR